MLIYCNPMKINTLYLPGFSHRLCGSRRGSGYASQLAGRSLTLDGLAFLVAKFIPMGVFARAGQRDRVFTPWITFCAFFGQVLQRGSSCRDAVRRVQAWYLSAGSKVSVDDATGGYCQARNRLAFEVIFAAFEHLVALCQSRIRAADLWQGRTVKVIDGCGLSMPDTASNRKDFAYAPSQREGCGFPTGQLIGLFSLATGHLTGYVSSSWNLGEIPLATRLLKWMRPGEILLADRGFSGWGLIALCQSKGIDVVMRLHHRRSSGVAQQLWRKPQRTPNWEKPLWDTLPNELKVRVVRIRIQTRGFRTECLDIVTTLLDEVRYPDTAIAELFRLRWQVEIDFRDIKTTLGLDVLRTLSVPMIEKEILLQCIAYNLVRLLMLEAARHHDVTPSRLSFKGTISTMRAFAALFATNPKQAAMAYENLLLALAADPVPYRPDRSEPRAVKRRPKNYPRLNRPRHEMVVSRFCRRKSTIAPLN